MSQDPERRDIDPETDKVWEVNVWISQDFAMYVVADSKEGAQEVAERYWGEEFRESWNSEIDGDVTVSRAVDKPIQDADWANSIPYGRTFFHGKQLKVNEIVELIANPPPAVYDTATILMPFVDAPPPLRTEP